MSKFIRKPLVIDAVQWFKDGDHPAVRQRGFLLSLKDCSTENCYVIKTLEGDMTVSKGDWIVTGVEGEHYNVKPHIFDKIYEKV